MDGPGREKCTYQVTKLSACWQALVTDLIVSTKIHRETFLSPNTNIASHPGIKQHPSRKDPPHES